MRRIAIERTVSTTNQPHHVVVTGVWDLPIGKTVLASNAVERAILGGFKFSEIFQAYSGSPLAITASSLPDQPGAEHLRTDPQSELLRQQHPGQRALGTGISCGRVDLGRSELPELGCVCALGAIERAAGSGVHVRQCAADRGLRRDRPGQLQPGPGAGSHLPAAFARGC